MSAASASTASRVFERLLTLPGWLWPALLSVVVFQPLVMTVGPDSAWYWVLAKNLHAGHGYVGAEWVPEVRRGPGLPLLLAASFRIFGEDVSSAAWVMRAAFIASGLLTYALGARWFGRGVGVVAACGLLTNSIAGGIANTVGGDIFGVLLVLVAILALEVGSWRGTGLAALALMATALTKEAALLFVIPLTVHIALTRSRRVQLPMLAVAASAAVLALLVWSLSAGGGALVLDRVASFVGGGGGTPVTVAEMLGGLWGFAVGTAEGSVFWPALLVGWTSVAYCAWRDASAPDRLVLWLGLALVPIMMLQGLYALRPGQSFMLYPLSFLAFARAVQLAAERYAPRWRLELLAVGGVLAMASGFAAEQPPSYWLSGAWQGGSSVDEGWTPNPLGVREGYPLQARWLNPVVDEAAVWLTENTMPDQALVSDWYWADSLYIRSNAARPIHRLPYVRSRDVSHMALESALEMPSLEDYAPALFVFSQSGRTIPSHPDAWLNALSEPLLFARLEQVGADWVILTKRRMMLSDYFDASPSFELAHTGVGGMIKIYRVRRPLVETPFDTGLKIELGLYLDALAKENPAGYDALVAEFFVAKLDVGTAEVAEWRDVLRAALAARRAEEDDAGVD